MLQRQVGHAGLRVSRVGLGTLTWGATIDAYEAAELLTIFADAGGTLVDTAPTYGAGKAEQVLGAALATTGLRDRVVLAGHAGRRTDGDEGPDASRGALLDQLDRTLAHLGTDHLDLWQVHGWDPAVDPDETWSAVEHAVRSGRVRYAGVSGTTAWQTAVAHAALRARPAREALATCQVAYSLLDRGAEAELVEAARHLGTGLLARAPLARGVLSAKYRFGVPGDSRGADAAWHGALAPHLTAEAAGIVEAVVRAAEGLGLTPAQVALAWVRDRPAVAAVLVGARTTAQLSEALASETVDVPAEILRALDDVSGAVPA